MWGNQVGSLTPQADSEGALQAKFYTDITQFGPFGHKFRTVCDQSGSENCDAVEQTSFYLAAQALAKDPEYAGKAAPGNMTVVSLVSSWYKLGFINEWFSENARRGLFVELGSTNCSMHSIFHNCSLHEYELPTIDGAPAYPGHYMPKRQMAKPRIL